MKEIISYGQYGEKEEIRNVIANSLKTASGSIEMGTCLDLYLAASRGSINYDDANFYVLRPNSNVEKIIKLSTLMPTTITLTNLNPQVSQIDHYVYFNSTKEINDPKHGLCEYEVYCHIPSDGLFTSCSRLFTEGLISYYPNTAFYITYPDGTVEVSKRNTIELSGATVDGMPILSNGDTLHEILSLEIPCIDGISLKDYEKIVYSHIDELHRFKQFFAKELHSIDFSKIQEKRDFEYELRKSIDDLISFQKKESYKLGKNIAVGVATTIIASLFVINDIEALLKTLSGLSGGYGVLKLVSSIFDYKINTVDIKGKDVYFLWLLYRK